MNQAFSSQKAFILTGACEESEMFGSQCVGTKSFLQLIGACDHVRRHKPQKAQFTGVNEHFWGKHNAEPSDNELRNRTLPLKL